MPYVVLQIARWVRLSGKDYKSVCGLQDAKLQFAYQ
jgi:hypothetical protein